MLVKGKAKDLLEDSINNALLAVEIYNKPKLENRIKSYIVHMNIAWTKAFHAYFHKTIGEKYPNRIVMINGEQTKEQVIEEAKQIVLNFIRRR